MRGLKVYLASNPADAEIVKDYLEGYGITAQVRDQYLWGGVGELPANSYPSVWVLDADCWQQARSLVEAFEHGATAAGRSWRCPRCRENLDPQFTQCWNCGSERPAGYSDGTDMNNPGTRNT